MIRLVAMAISICGSSHGLVDRGKPCTARSDGLAHWQCQTQLADTDAVTCIRVCMQVRRHVPVLQLGGMCHQAQRAHPEAQASRGPQGDVAA
jgi:hypothetical protein